MTQNLLRMSPTAYQQMLFRRVFMCVCSILFTLCLNLFFLSFFDKWNRQLLFFLNVVTDILCGCGLIAYTTRYPLIPCPSRRSCPPATAPIGQSNEPAP